MVDAAGTGVPTVIEMAGNNVLLLSDGRMGQYTSLS